MCYILYTISCLLYSILQVPYIVYHILDIMYYRLYKTIPADHIIQQPGIAQSRASPALLYVPVVVLCLPRRWELFLMSLLVFPDGLHPCSAPRIWALVAHPATAARGSRVFFILPRVPFVATTGSRAGPECHGRAALGLLLHIPGWVAVAAAIPRAAGPTFICLGVLLVRVVCVSLAIALAFCVCVAAPCCNSHWWWWRSWW